MLKGRYITTLDKSGRVRLPSKFRKSLEGDCGNEVFVTSLDGENVHIFPVPEWMKMTRVLDEKRLENPNVRSFVRRVNRLGVRREIDNQGRILIHKELREKVKLLRKIVLEGAENHLIFRHNAF